MLAHVVIDVLARVVIHVLAHVLLHVLAPLSTILARVVLQVLAHLLAPSGALVVIMVYYISAAQPTFSIFSNSSDSKVKVKVKGPNMCYIFEKHGIQGYRI